MQESLPSLEFVRVQLSRRCLEDFVNYTYPGYQSGWFTKVVCESLQKFYQNLQEGKSPRLILQAPPRHGKSELISRRFPAWVLGQDPDMTIIACSYSSDLANRNSRDVQGIIESPSYQEIFPETKIAGMDGVGWGKTNTRRTMSEFGIVGRRGEYRAAGVGGSVTGFGGKLLIIDDPLKDWSDASSPIVRQTLWDWYTSTLLTRQAPSAGILVMQTRWHSDDLIGRLLDRQKHGEGEPWTVLSFPAIAEHDEIYRRAGEALHPDRYPIERLESWKSDMAGNVWASLFQQRPVPEGGGLIKISWFSRYSSFPGKFQRILQSWDCAYKPDQINDPSVCITFGDFEGKYYVLDVFEGRLGYPDLRKAVISNAMTWNPDIILIEDAASGTSLIQDLEWQGLNIIPVKPEKSKEVRLVTVSAIIESGRVVIPDHAVWLADFENQMSLFPAAAHDDMVDSLSQALGYFRDHAQWFSHSIVGTGIKRIGASLPWG